VRDRRDGANDAEGGMLDDRQAVVAFAKPFSEWRGMFAGNTMLLPNHNLDAAYQKVDLSGSYRIVPRVRWYVSVENLFNQSYNATFGFPALTRGARTGVTVTFGGR
jgi:outer membrane receptor protein involved in Fe transport